MSDNYPFPFGDFSLDAETFGYGARPEHGSQSKLGGSDLFVNKVARIQPSRGDRTHPGFFVTHTRQIKLN